MAYLPSAQSSPWAGMQYVNTEPDIGGFAKVLGGLAQTFEQTRQADADRSLEMYRIQTAANQQTASNMLNYLQEIRQNRLQESQQAMEMLRLSSEMKEANYRMEQARKLDDAKWQARDARSQLLPLLSDVDGRIQDNDLWGASQMMKQAFRIPGVTDDETSMKLLMEQNNLLNKYRIDDKPALQVLNALKSEATASFGSGSWDKLRDAMKRVSAGSNLDEVSRQLTSDMGAPAGQAAKIKSFLQKGVRTQNPEDVARLKQIENSMQESFLQNAIAKMGDPSFDMDSAMDDMLEMKERTRQLMMYGDYSIFRSSDHPTMDYDAVNNLIQPVKQNMSDLTNLFDTIRQNATTRAAFLQGRSLEEISDKDTIDKLKKKNPQAYDTFIKLLQQRNPKLADSAAGNLSKKPSELRKFFSSSPDYYFHDEEGVVKKLDNDLSIASSNLLGFMSKMDSNPKSVNQNDIQQLAEYASQLDSLLEPFYGPGSVSMDLLNKYTSRKLARQIRQNMANMNRFNAMGGVGGMSTIPSTSAPTTGTTTGLPWEGNQ